MSGPAVSAVEEQRELALVGKVEMRIALADTDAKLEALLKTYLAPLLLKLASSHASVRNKVVSVCQHLNTRVKPRSVKLPVAALVAQCKDQTNSLVRHFDILYLQMGAPRLSAQEQAALLPIVVQGISKSGAQASQMFHLLLRLLEPFHIPLRGSPEDTALRSQLEASDEDVAFLVTYLAKLLLFAPPPRGSRDTPSSGLSIEDYKFFTLQGKVEAWDTGSGGLNLPRTKTLVARLLASGLFNDKERFLPALFAAADPSSALSDIGGDMLKRALPVADLEDEKLIAHLFDLYFGTQDVPRVKAPLRLRILNLLNKSLKSTGFAHRISAMVTDGVATAEHDGEDVIMGNAPSQPSASVGREASKLRAAIFSYIDFVARHGAPDTLRVVAQQIVVRLRDFIENQGWPKPGSNEDLVSRGYAYEVIGLLAKAGPRTLLIEEQHPTLDLTRWLFDSLARDSSGNSITVSIESSLSTVLAALERLRLSPDEQKLLEDVLISQIQQSDDLEAHQRLRSTRYVAVRFANRCLPYNSARARWIDTQALGAQVDRPEVHEEAERGLSPYWHQMLRGASIGGTAPQVAFPTFNDVIQQFFLIEVHVNTTDPAVATRRIRELDEHKFAHMTRYARRLLIQEALAESKSALPLDSDWERKLDLTAEGDEQARILIRNHMHAIDQTSRKELEILLCALFEYQSLKHVSSDDHLVEFLSLAPDALVRIYVSRATSIVPLLQSSDHARRCAAAHAFGLLASHPSAERDVRASIPSLLKTVESWGQAVGAGVNSTHGAALALGFYYSRCANRAHTALEPSDEFERFLKSQLDVLQTTRDDLLHEASCVALGQLCMYQGLTPQTLASYVPVSTITDKLYEKAKGGNEPAVLCLGQLAMILPETSPEQEDRDLKHVGDQLHKLHEIRQFETHFTVGEALTYLACGWQSAALATKLDIDEQRPRGPARDFTLPTLVDTVLADCANTKPALKKAAVMWLLCLVQYCGTLPAMRERLRACQTAFRRCLADRDELVQESASRGLGLVYEKGDRALKDDLVRELITSFSSDKQQLAGNVSAETQLFEPGALPTGEGSVSTYKDIMSLAAEVGDSSLVYRFMSMASSNAIWSSRAAFGRFGLSRVLSDASVDGYLADNPKLYPKLFRYRFDPNGGVQRSMNEIWNALVSDSTAVVNQHFDAIMEDLLTSILGKEWRVRQACCAAIADLVQGRSVEQYEKYLERIWTQCFRVLDDIKESVRAAAASLARTLTGVLTRSLATDHATTKSAASAMLQHVLPFLLSPSGMESSAQEVQLFAVRTLLDIIKHASAPAIRPYLPDLVSQLIGLLSSLEPEAVNYIHLNASKYNLTEQKIDDMRLSSVRSSPLMEAIERCLDLLDEPTMSLLQPQLQSAMKSAVGLPSKVGACRVLVSLATRRMVLFRPYADDTLRLLEKLVLDRNDTVSSSYAAAAGYVVRGASDAHILRFVRFAQSLYFEPSPSGGDRDRRGLTAGELMLNFAKQASDRFKSFATAALPFVFIAKHDSHPPIKDVFKETWEEAVAGSRAVSLYLSEILTLAGTHLDAPQWTLKHTAARAVAETVQAVASANDSNLSDSTIASLWSALSHALNGKTWEGKEIVVAALPRFASAARVSVKQNSGLREEVLKIAIREGKRQNKTYRHAAIKALGGVASAWPETDLFDAVAGVVKPIFEEDSMDIDVGADGGERGEAAKDEDDLKNTTFAHAIEALLASVQPLAAPSAAITSQISSALRSIAVMPASGPPVWRSVYQGLAALFDRMHDADSRAVRGTQTLDLPLDAHAQTDLRDIILGTGAATAVGIEALRLTRADAVTAMVRARPSLIPTLRDPVLTLLRDEPSPSVRDRLASAAEW